MTTFPRQEQFFEYLIRLHGKDKVLMGVMEVLDIKVGAAYKRLNGRTALSMDDLLHLAKHFRVSVDTAANHSDFMSFAHPFMKGSSSMSFLDRYTAYLKPLTTAKQSSLTYMANELPVFYYFAHRYIFNFLIAVWSHLHWRDSQIKIHVNQSIDPQIDMLRNQVSSYYGSHPVTEIWNANMLSNLYQQIIFAITTRSFGDPDFVGLLINDIDSLIYRLKRIASSGVHEQTSTKMTILLNEFGNYMNLAVYRSEHVSTAFVGFDIPHFMVSYSKPFLDFCEVWVEKIKSRSVRISGDGYQSRELFFLKMNKDFADFKDRVDKLMAVYYG